jgi:hypothetical protein
LMAFAESSFPFTSFIRFSAPGLGACLAQFCPSGISRRYTCRLG